MTRRIRMARFIQNRRGAIIVLTAILLIGMLAFVAFTVDIGYIQLTRTQLQSAADGSALAGAMELSGIDDPALVRTNARAAIQQTAALYHNGDRTSVSIDPISDITFGRLNWNGNLQNYQFSWGDASTPYNVVKVRAMRSTGSGDNRLPLLFAPIFGTQKVDVGAEAIATFQPRDIMITLDFSGSMNDDSCLGRIGTLGRTYIESNLQTMWNELGSPIYGNLTFTPKYATLKGRAASGTIPHIEVTYKRTSISMTSTLALSQVKLLFSNGATQTLTGLSGLTGSFAGTGGNSGKEITSCWVKSGTNGSLSSGNLGEQFDFTDANIKTALGLTGPYPYSSGSGSWQEYLDTVQSSSGSIKNAGYRDMYGYLTWIEYLQTVRYSATDTPDLWKTSEQPVGCMKDSVDLFIDYLQQVEAEDYVGLSIYTHSNAVGAILEHGMTQNIMQVKDTTRHRQAGHYKPGTNISAGMKVAREELVAHSRPRSFRMMILLTDGLPNEPSSVSQATAAVIAEANAAKAAKIKILTVSLGVGADTSLMQQVADITGGVHYNVPGGSNIATVRANLQAVFREIAASRPLRLISGK